jgi:ADP-ribose pyrophosphatase YjhB (NUDIX family)
MEENKKTIVRVRAIILHQCKLLLVRHPHDTSFAALPGGHLEWGEDVKECLHRELVEELGVEPKIGRLLFMNSFSQSDGKHYLEFFLEVKNGEDYLHTDNLFKSHASEIAEILWVSPADHSVNIMPKGLAEHFRTGRIISDEVRYIKD